MPDEIRLTGDFLGYPPKGLWSRQTFPSEVVIRACQEMDGYLLPTPPGNGDPGALVSACSGMLPHCLTCGSSSFRVTPNERLRPWMVIRKSVPDDLDSRRDHDPPQLIPEGERLPTLTELLWADAVLRTVRGESPFLGRVLRTSSRRDGGHSDVVVGFFAKNIGTAIDDLAKCPDRQSVELVTVLEV